MIIETSPLGPVPLDYPHILELCKKAHIAYSLERSTAGVHFCRWSVVPNYEDGKKTLTNYFMFEAKVNYLLWRIDMNHKNSGSPKAALIDVIDRLLLKTQGVKLEDGSSVEIKLDAISGLDRYIDVHNELARLGVTGYDFREPREVKMARIKQAKSGMTQTTRVADIAQSWS